MRKILDQRRKWDLKKVWGKSMNFFFHKSLTGDSHVALSLTLSLSLPAILFDETLTSPHRHRPPSLLRLSLPYSPSFSSQLLLFSLEHSSSLSSPTMTNQQFGPLVAQRRARANKIDLGGVEWGEVAPQLLTHRQRR